MKISCIHAFFCAAVLGIICNVSAEADPFLAAKLEKWQNAMQNLTRAEENFRTLAGNNVISEKVSKEIQNKGNLLVLKSIIEKAARKGAFEGEEERTGDAITKQLTRMTGLLEQAASAELLTYVVNPVDGSKILPGTPLLLEDSTDEMRVLAARGEFEPASFVVFSRNELKDITLQIGDLKSQNGQEISASCIDVKVVKCWYQTGINWKDGSFWEGTRVLVPELLLNDDSLIKTDELTKDNFVKLVFEGKAEYRKISDPDEAPQYGGGHSGGSDVLRVREFPVRDSRHLQPVSIPAFSNKQFWLTVCVPESAAAGIYSSSILLLSGGKELATVKLRLRVLPFSLPQPRTHYDMNQEFVSSIYYLSQLCSCCPEGTISAGHKSSTQLFSELKNLFDHGVTNPILYECEGTRLEEYLQLRSRAGMSNRTLYDLSFHFPGRIDADFRTLSRGVPVGREQLERLKNALTDFLSTLRKYGVEEVYVYGYDEAVDDGVIAQIPAWQVIQETGAKVFTSGYYRAGLWHNKRAQFDLAGDDLDLFVSANETPPEEAARWHSKGKRIWSYANPQAGAENPALYRRNFGFQLWLSNYDGAATWVYIHSSGWNDFNAPGKDFNFVYPTVDGVVDTIAWEGYREAIDDIRYGTLLKQLISEKSATAEKASDVQTALRCLENLDASKSPEQIRMEITECILRLL